MSFSNLQLPEYFSIDSLYQFSQQSHEAGDMGVCVRVCDHLFTEEAQRLNNLTKITCQIDSRDRL